MTKPKVAFFEFTGCEGCQLTVLNLEERLLDLVELVDVVAFREAMDRREDDYDVVFVEGSITRASEIPRLEKIRKQAKVLVALGACSCIGGVNCLKNFMPTEEVQKIVYGSRGKEFPTILAKPIDAVVKVDYYIHGCPPDLDEFVEVTKSILFGRKPNIPNYPVCVECRMKENVCVFDKGMSCLGPVTRAGCKAICPTYGEGCGGCRGLIEDANFEAHQNLLLERGMSLEDAISCFKVFRGFLNPEPIRKIGTG